VNYIPESFDVSTISSLSTSPYGASPLVFELDKRGDLLGKIELIITRSKITAASGTSTINDFEGYSSIDNVRFYYSNKMFHEVYGERLIKRLFKEKSPQIRENAAKLQFGFLSDVERGCPNGAIAGAGGTANCVLPAAFNLGNNNSTNALTTITWTADLMVPWENINKRIPMVVMPNKIRVEVQLKPLSKFCRSSSGSDTFTTAALSQAALRCYYTHHPQEQRTDLYNHVNTERGVVLKTATDEYHMRESVAGAASGAYTFRLKTKNLKNATIAIEPVLRMQQNVDNSAAQFLDLWNWQIPARFWMEDSGSQIVVKQETNDGNTAGLPIDYNQRIVNGRCWPNGIQGLNLPILPFVEPQFVEPSENDCFGSRNMSKYNNPEFIIQWDAGTPATVNSDRSMYLDLWARIHNALIYHRGDIRKFLL